MSHERPARKYNPNMLTFAMLLGCTRCVSSLTVLDHHSSPNTPFHISVKIMASTIACDTCCANLAHIQYQAWRLTWMSCCLNSLAMLCESPRTANFPVAVTVQLGAPRLAPVALVKARKPRFPYSLGLSAIVSRLAAVLKSEKLTRS